MEARGDVVERLCDGATQGMLLVAKAEKTTIDEVFSAYMTLALRTVKYGIEIKADLRELKGAIERIYSEFPEETVN